MAHSVLARLKNRAKERGEDFNFVLTRYGIERLLYRLSISPHAERLILKGGTLLLAWQGESYRVTRDIDLLGRGRWEPADAENVFKTLCTMPVPENDGIIFLPDSVKVSEIKEVDQYPGIRIKLRGAITNVKLDLQIDIGVGDVITPGVETIDYPTFLDMPAPKLQVYPRYTVIAEKFEALVSLGIRNSRMKDFYDIWLMSRLFEFEGDTLKQAVENTFKRRQSLFPEQMPFALTAEFYADSAKQTQWAAFLKGKIETFGEQPDLKLLIEEIAYFLMPLVEAVQKKRAFTLFWSNSSRSWREAPAG